MVGGALLPFQVTCGGGSSGLIETLFYTLQPEVQLLAAHFGSEKLSGREGGIL